MLVMEIKMAGPDMNEDFYLDTDASALGMGGVLYQLINGKRKLLAIRSKNFV